MTRRLLLLFACALLTSSLASAQFAEAPREWAFSVLLDGSPIGYHRFELLPRGDGHEVRSEARFDVRFLFFNAFRYRHSNREVWDGQCLQSINANTRQNDKQYVVSGERVDDRFVLEANDDEDTLRGCVMTFAYWDPRFLEQTRLLNPQSGEYLPVEVEALGRRDFTVRGETVKASAYRLSASQVELTVWYSENDEWLGLESIARGGRVLRYELT